MESELPYTSGELRAAAAAVMVYLEAHPDAPAALWEIAERLQPLLDGVEPESLGGAEELGSLVRDGIQYVEARSP
jgi:hypothetical protein